MSDSTPNELRIRCMGTHPGMEFVEIEDGEGNSINPINRLKESGGWTFVYIDVTPNEELRELVEQWRELNIGGEYEAAAEELEELIGDE